MEGAVALPFWISNLIAYSLQIAILAAAGTLLVYIFRLRLPRVTLTYWQILLMACICLPFLQRWDRPVLGPAISGNGSVSVGAPYLAVPMSLNPPMQLPWEILGIILAAGIVLKLAWLMLGFLRLHLFQRRSRMFLEEHASVQDMQWRTGVRVPLLLSDEIDSPVTFGFRSPRIILPLSFKKLSEPCQKAVLCHELLHVRRYDWILIVAEEVVGSLFWFHPGVWWLLNRIQLSREQAVDYEVVQLTGNKQPYLDSLLEFARAQGRPKAVPAPLFLKESHLVQRVALLLKEVSMSRSRLAVSIISIFLLLTGTIYLSAGWFPLTGAPLAAQEQNSRAEVRAPQTTPIQVAGDIQESKLIHRVEPVYPEQAKSIGLQGIVKLSITINEEGFVYELKVESGHPILVEAAIEAVKQWQYSPTLLNGEPVAAQAMVTVVFNLK
jgi:TonB family protein